MANVEHSSHISPSTTRVSATQSDAVSSRRDLASWWKGFKRGNKLEEPKVPAGIFGIPLHESIRYANVAISLFNDNGESYIYGYVPIVVAKCGVFLKEKATETEGIFRLAGSEKRIKELKIAFDSPERYGKGLEWTGYTVHDAANILRRYFNQLPEPIIPLDFYERFRDPLRHHQEQAVGQIDEQTPGHGGFIPESAIRAYQGLITELPPLNRQLLLYILDLLAVFASKSDLNKMTTPNLAAIFQPGILSHPQHDMAPQEYRLSQDVLIFLIENQDSFLIGMHGTAADEKTVKDVQSGYQPSQPNTSPTAPGRSKTVIGRSTSNASGGTEGGRRPSGMRRNISTSSRNSRQSSLQAGGSPAMGSPSLGSSGVHRSNTVPSQRPIASSPRYPIRGKGSDPTTPSAVPEEMLPESVVAGGEPSRKTPVATRQAGALLQPPSGLEITSASSSEATTPLAGPGGGQLSSAILPKEDYEREVRAGLLTPEPARRERDGSSERSASNATSSSRNFLDIFRGSPGSDSEKREGRLPRKLQKKRAPDSTLSSAHSSTNDLGDVDAADSVASPATPNYRETDPMNEVRSESRQQPPHLPAALRHQTTDALRPSSPPRSVQSAASATDDTDAEFLDDATTREKQEKKRRWRFSHSAKSKHLDAGSPGTTPPMPPPLSATASSTATSPNPATIEPSAASRASSSAHEAVGGDITPRDSREAAGGGGGADVLSSDAEGERKRGPLGWIKGKIQERKERAKSPSGGPPPAEGGGGGSGNRKSNQFAGSEGAGVRRLSSEGLAAQTLSNQESAQAAAGPVAAPATASAASIPVAPAAAASAAPVSAPVSSPVSSPVSASVSAAPVPAVPVPADPASPSSSSSAAGPAASIAPAEEQKTEALTQEKEKEKEGEESK